MFPLYDKHTYNNIGTKKNVQVCRQEMQSIKARDCKADKDGFSFFKDVISNIVPALKNLK
jgi:hypothetical protein